MKQRLLSVLWLGISLFCCSNPVVAADSPKSVLVACYPNRPRTGLWTDPVGNRVSAILSAQKIDYFGVGSAGMTIYVQADRAAEALKLLAKAIKAEKLPISLFDSKGHVIKPDDVLKPKKVQ